MAKRYIVTLTAKERTFLHGLISKGKTAAFKQRHARILLKTDQGPQGEGWTNEQIGQALEVHPGTVERLRKRFVFQKQADRRPNPFGTTNCILHT